MTDKRKEMLAIEKGESYEKEDESNPVSPFAAVRLPEVGNKFEDKQDLFGLGENKHYVLLANTYDCTFLKNRLTFYLAEQPGMEFVPQGVNVELYVNEEYQGNYLLCEQVRIGKSRIEIEELKEETEAPDIWGGYLLSFSPWEDQEEENIFKTSRGVAFYNDTPGFVSTEKEQGTPQQKQYIRDYVQRCEDAIYMENSTDYEELIDVVSAADYWLIQEFSQLLEDMDVVDCLEFDVLMFLDVV